ncbi:wound-induced protein, Wun1, NTF2-like domain protein [Artemisia annua]|uniref:Wound-induced protein, Wun1, NTF2-like domain protein n=1 Tax=Artemisia annua TaxID=35608 RepID=A0A2U1LUS4_ARTAN|nr:wound-induced protein, Wun1, NTF2-like domain protein [Artemisia annua]
MADQHQPTPVEECNRNMVSNFYKALGSRDAATVHSLLAPDIEWWFHGPPSCNRLMRWLTGSTTNTFDDHSFAFNPISVVSIGSIVVAEGCSPMDCKVSWVHAWTVTDGVITQLRACSVRENLGRHQERQV